LGTKKRRKKTKKKEEKRPRLERSRRTFVRPDQVPPVILAVDEQTVRLDGVIVGPCNHGQPHVRAPAQNEGVEGADAARGWVGVGEWERRQPARVSNMAWGRAQTAAAWWACGLRSKPVEKHIDLFGRHGDCAWLRWCEMALSFFFLLGEREPGA
jgi:hypothetical protein